MAKVVRDLGTRYGLGGSALVLQDGCFYVVSRSESRFGSQALAFPATSKGRVTSWREVAGDYGRTIEEVVAELEDVCHCGARLNRSDHCPACGCEQYEADCGERP